ncbi:MAG TPA: hypothetical protein VFF68_11575 [Anaerolineaceae bacterium]|nr:hypothetical protein [Anaerolineaceae bacterium]
MTEPQPGSVIQGSVTVTGTTVLEDFVLAELAFQYTQGDPEAWFPLGTMDRPVQAEPLAVWDTTTITDGDYRLRLRVYRSDGSHEEVQVEGLRVRNYSTIETATPTLPPPTAAATLVPTRTARPTEPAVLVGSGTPTAMPVNPATISTGDIFWTALRGALVALAGFGLVGAYLWIRSENRGG